MPSPVAQPAAMPADTNTQTSRSSTSTPHPPSSKSPTPSASASASASTSRPTNRPQPVIFNPPVWDLNAFANIFTAFKRKAALDLLSEHMSSGGPGGDGRRLQGNPGGFPPNQQQGMQAFQGGLPPTFVPGPEGLMMLADTMMRPASQSSFASSSSSPSPVVPRHLPGYSNSQMGQLGLQWPQGVQGYPDMNPNQQIQQQQSFPQPPQQYPPEFLQFQAAYNPPLPYGMLGQAGPSQMAMSPQDMQLSLQTQMLYLQWQQQQLRMATGGQMPTPSQHSPTSTSGFSHEYDPAGSSSPGQGSDPDSPVDDKRRRNTEASARFRAKKKERYNSLAHTIGDLESRANNLEKEASSLRTENTWLKEMVILKGRRNMELQGRHSAGPDGDDGDDEEEEQS